ncbi:MAG: DNA polymerase IV [Acidimicrobiaceae bacterium]|nr:DNA polymerase IV [Acidimicrobiaceae bacterium]
MTTETRGRPPDGTVGFLHVDMDAFYAAVEIRRRPELRGKPVVVGGTGSRGVVAAASYEARHFGIHSAMPSVRARRLCPHAVFLPGDHAHYAEVSARVMTVLRDVTPLVEPLSLDEAFLDVRGVARLLGPAPELAASIRARVLEQEQLTCSVGVASTKFMAKLATERAKPRAGPSGPERGPGVCVVEAGTELDFLHPLPITALFGVGPATSRRLRRLGIETVGDLASLPESAAVSALGAAAGRQLHQLANGIDDRPVVVNRPPRSISHEETFARDLHTATELEAEATRLADAVARRLRTSKLQSRTITLKLRFGDFKTITRSVTLPDPTDGSRDLVAASRELLAQIDVAGGVRLLGVGASGLVEASARQLTFGLDASGDGPEGSEAADRVTDQIRDRFGASAIGPAAAVRDGSGIRSPSDADQRWGPAADGSDHS